MPIFFYIRERDRAGAPTSSLRRDSWRIMVVNLLVEDDKWMSGRIQASSKPSRSLYYADRSLHSFKLCLWWWLYSWSWMDSERDIYFYSSWNGAQNLYEDMKGFAHHMDCSSFPKSNPCHNVENDRKLGYFKDECSGVQPLEFVGLRSKMYSLQMPQDYSDKMTAKGVKTSFVRKHIQHETFVHSLKTHSKTKVTYLDIR